MNRYAASAIVALSIGVLAGCGLKGDLERPMPLWGDPPRVDADDPRTIKENEERAAAEKARLDAERAAARQAEADELRRAGEALEQTPASPPQ